MDKDTAKTKLKELVEQFSSAYKNKDYVNEQNEEVYKMYGITKEEQKIIEESLK